MTTIGAIDVRGIARRVASALVLATCALQLTATVAAAAPAAAVTTASVAPAAFVPDWDGHSDATLLTYSLTARSTVTVRVLDARGHAVDVVEQGTRDAGTHVVTWDARLAGDRLATPGRYTMRVDAVPTASAGSGVRSARTTASVVGSARAAAVEVQAPPVAIRGVRLSRPALGRSGKAGVTSAIWDLTTPASVSVVIVDAANRGVRTLRAGRASGGAGSVAWNGRRDDGSLVADGDYSLVVAATGPGRPTATTRVPVHVDRTVPTIRTSRATRVRSANGRLVVPVTVVASEASTLVARMGRRSVRQSLVAGTRQLTFAASDFGITARAKARNLPLTLTLTDGAGNTAVARTSVIVPATTARPATPKPDPTPPVTTPPPANPGGRLAWPVGGIVTSEFGPRDGRAHTGLDIAVPTGTPIHPAAAGTVSFVGVLGGYGNLVIVEHPSGLRTYYAHMSKFGAYAVGQSVTHVDVIGFVGCTGNCSGPHVHFETRVADVPRDPRGYLVPR